MMQYMIRNSDLQYDVRLYDLPEGVLSLHGMPRSFDSREVPYEAHVFIGKYPTQEEADAAVDDIVAGWRRQFEKTISGAKAIEWRSDPRIEFAGPITPEDAANRYCDPDPMYRVQVRGRFSVHT
jgi:hypothetical protein